MVGSSNDEEESSNSNKQLLDSLRAIMDESMATMRAEMRAKLERSNNDRQRREQKIKPKPPDNTSSSTWRSSQKTSHSPKSTFYVSSDYQHANELQLFRFSGKENYLEWERNMDNWFCYNKVLKREKLGFAIEQLTGSAYKWWQQEREDRRFYKKPTITSWESLKELLWEKYAPRSRNKSPTTTEHGKATKDNNKQWIETFTIQMEQVLNDHYEALRQKHQQRKEQEESQRKEIVLQENAENKMKENMEIQPCELKQCHTMEHENDKAEGSTKEKNPHLMSTTSQACRAHYVSNITIFKAEMLPNILRGTQVSLDCEFIHYWNIFTFTRSFKQPVLNVKISSIIHLILSLSAKDDTGTIDVCKDMPSNSGLMTCSLANKRSKEVSNTLLKEQTESKTVEQFPYFKKSLEAKCILSSTQSDSVLEKLTSLEPVYPSSIVCFSQILEEESPKTMQRSLPMIDESEQPTSLVPKHVLMPFPFDYPRKHCKEIDLVRTEPNLFVMVSAQDEKRFGLENVKEFCVSKSVFDKIIPTFETFTLEKFLELNGFMFEEFCEFDSSLKVSLYSDAFELFRTKTENALVKTFSELKHVIKNELCDSNLFNVLCKPTVNNHVLEFSTSSIMHLFCPMSVEKGTGAMENHKYLRELTIQEKPPDLHQPQSIRGAREELTYSIQIREDPPDICQQNTYHFGIWSWKYLRKTTSITQGCFIPKLYFDNNYMIICSIFFFVPKLFPFDVGDPAFLQFKSTNQDHGKVAKESSMFKDKPPDPIPFTLMIMITEHIENLIQVSNSLIRFASYDSRAVIMSSTHPENVERRIGLFIACLEPNSCFKMLVKEEHEMDNALIIAETCLSVYYVPVTAIIHLIFAKSVDNFSGTKEEPPDLKVISSSCFARTGIGDVFIHDKKPIDYFRMIFEVGERVWTPRIDGSFHLTRRNINNAYQLDLRGKHPIMLLFDGSNLVLFVAGQTDLRTNPFQLGEDDAILESSKDLEHGAWMGNKVMDEHRAKGAWKAHIGPKNCSRTKKYHQSCRVLLRQAMTQEDHLSYKDDTKTSLVKVHAQGAWQVTMKHTNTLFPFSSVFPKWFSGERFLMRFVGFMSHLCHLLRLIHLGPFTSS